MVSRPVAIFKVMFRLNGAGPHFLSQSLSERADGRFVWNGHLLKGYRGPECRNFCLPIVHGFVAVNNVTVNGYNFSWILVSRRSVQRAGTRLFRRGIDRYVCTKKIPIFHVKSKKKSHRYSWLFTSVLCVCYFRFGIVVFCATTLPYFKFSYFFVQNSER